MKICKYIRPVLLGFITGISSISVWSIETIVVTDSRFESSIYDTAAAISVITEEDIRTHPLRNRITRCLGSMEDVVPDFSWVDINDGDKLILCSDGLWEMVHEDLILAIVSSSKNPEEICKKLIDAANNSGGVDNISVVTALFSKE